MQKAVIYFSVTRARVSKWVMWLILNSHSKENMRSDQPNTKHSDWRALQFFNQSKQVILKNFSKNIFQVQKYLNLYRERKEGKEEKEKQKRMHEEPSYSTELKIRMFETIRSHLNLGLSIPSCMLWAYFPLSFIMLSTSCKNSCVSLVTGCNKAIYHLPQG